MKKLICLTALLLLVFASCKKEELPSPSDEIANLICNGQGWPEATEYNPMVKGVHPLTYIFYEASVYRDDFDPNLPKEWRPTDLSSAQLMICGSVSYVISETCFYSNNISLNRLRIEVALILKIAKTGEILASQSFIGSEPGNCPLTINQNSSPDDIYGDITKMQSQIKNWLQLYVVK